MFDRIRSSPLRTPLALWMISVLLAQVVPRPAHALTSGPNQQEYEEFQPIDTSSMVSPYTGDLNYSVPLMVVPGPGGGYPINLSYNSSVGVEQEASWVGLGWTLSAGAISRSVRALPDDFDGDKVSDEIRMRDSVTAGVGFSIKPGLNPKTCEFAGFPNGSKWDFDLHYNNLSGWGFGVAPSATLGLGDSAKLSLGLGYDSQGGTDVQTALSVGDFAEKDQKVVTLGSGVNSRGGLHALSFSANFSGAKKLNKRIDQRRPGNKFKLDWQGGSMSFPFSASAPQVSLPMKGATEIFDGKFSIKPTKPYNPCFPYAGTISVETTHLDPQSPLNLSTPAYGYLHTEGAAETDLTDVQHGRVAWSRHVPHLPPSVYAYDLFSVSGHGIGGTFRAFRDGIDVLTTPTTTSKHPSHRVSVDYASTGSGFWVGAGYTQGTGENRSGPWRSGNAIADAVADTADEAGHEHTWFKMIGEPTPMTSGAADLLNVWGGDTAVRVELKPDNILPTGNWTTLTTVADPFGAVGAHDASSSKDVQVARERRTASIQALTAVEAEQFGRSRSLTWIEGATGATPTTSKFPSNGDVVQDHHLSEISILRPDGGTYVYGLPVYNRKQVEVAFRVGEGDACDGSEVKAPTSQGANAVKVWEWSGGLLGDGAKTDNVSLVAAQSWTNADGTDLSLPTKCDIINDGLFKDDDTHQLDGYASIRTLPPYASSWLITEILGADYVDQGADGLTADDLGTWVKFTYRRTDESWRWRTPYSDAALQTGAAGRVDDNLATFTYGEREQYYLASIETPTHIATFDIEPREDGYEAAGQYAAEGAPVPGVNAPSYRLAAIHLRARGSAADAPDIQTVHFAYSYALGRNVPNNQHYNPDPSSDTTGAGKLTLEKVWFTWQGTERGVLSPYVFGYGDLKDTDNNPRYDPRDVDRWGFYKDNTDRYAKVEYPFNEMPYTDQSRPSQGKEWLLQSVRLPTGATLRVEYEPDDYAWVEGKRAMQMYDIRGTTDTKDDDLDDTARGEKADTWLTLATTSAETSGHRVYFTLEHPVTDADLTALSVTGEQYVKDYLVRDLNRVGFKVFINLLEHGDASSHPDGQEWVSGYARVKSCLGCAGLKESGAVGVQGYDLGYITLMPEARSDRPWAKEDLHPFSLAAMTHMRRDRGDLLAHPLDFGDPQEIFEALFGVMFDLQQMFQGFNTYAYDNGMSDQILGNGWSMIRLYGADAKSGGGSRVARLRLEEGVYDKSGDTSYGSVYHYTTEDGESSGVAYEPPLGGEESALRQPIDYEDSIPLRSDDALFLEEPVLGDLYPGPSVGYGRVVVESLARQQTREDSGPAAKMAPEVATPVTVYTFYTPKDFPVQADSTSPTSDAPKYEFLFIPGVESLFRKKAAASEGHSLVLNDMAGRPRAVTTLVPAIDDKAQDRVLARTEYLYRVQNPDDTDGPWTLDNADVPVTGDTTATLGESYDIYLDMHEDSLSRDTYGADLNTQWSATGVPTFIFPLPSFSQTDVSTRTVTLTKVIYRTGLLQEVRTTSDHGTSLSRIMRYDAETGAPVVTRERNAWHEGICTFEQPAWWTYDGMAGAWRNLGARVLATASDGKGGLMLANVDTDEVETLFQTGDEVRLFKASGAAPLASTTALTDETYTVEKVDAGAKKIRLIDVQGAWYTGGPGVVAVVHSGYRNLTDAPGGAWRGRSGALVTDGPQRQTSDGSRLDPCWSDPTVAGKSWLPDWLEATASTWSEAWPPRCDVIPDPGGAVNMDGSQDLGTCDACEDGACETDKDGLINPWRHGVRGVWAVSDVLAFRTARQSTDNITVDGGWPSASFVPFDATLSVAANEEQGWLRTTTTTRRTPEGQDVESRDATGAYSAALYGYGDLLPTSLGVSTRYRELLFDAFEDNELQSGCGQAHWDVLDHLAAHGSLSTEEAHTGRRSLAVSGSALGDASVSVRFPVTADPEEDVAYAVTEGAKGLTMAEESCLGGFAPARTDGEGGARTYVVQAWVKETGDADRDPIKDGLGGMHTQVQVRFGQGSGSGSGLKTDSKVVLEPEGPVIEGWQRVSGSVTVPGWASTMTLELVNSSGEAAITSWFDDLRVFPFEATVKSFVYDAALLKPLAELDAEDFATFYLYDEEGRLEQVRRETPEGVLTVSEGRQAMVGE